MDLLNALTRNAVEISERIELVIHAAHIDVVHVEQDQAIGLVARRREEFRTVMQRLPESEIAG